MTLGADIDWDEPGTLRHTVFGYDIRTDPLWILVATAKQGHEGDLADMAATMASGHLYGPDDLLALALRPDRKWRAAGSLQRDAERQS